MTTKAESHVDVLIASKDRKELANALSMALADTYILYVKTQNFHWNVKGKQFVSLHKLFEEQYVELTAAVDLIAERIRALGYFAPGSFAEFLKLTCLEEGDSRMPAEQMIEALMKDNEKITQTLRTALSKAEEFHDHATVDLFTDRMSAHEKAGWMLRALIEE